MNEEKERKPKIETIAAKFEKKRRKKKRINEDKKTKPKTETIATKFEKNKKRKKKKKMNGEKRKPKTEA